MRRHVAGLMAWLRRNWEPFLALALMAVCMWQGLLLMLGWFW